MNILVVDDSSVMRKLVVRALRQAGFGDHDIVEAENGREALDLIKNEAPGAVLADWNMPEMTGIDLLHALNDEGHSIPFGFVTSESTVAMKDEAYKAGAKFFITKPFTAEAFSENLGGVL